MNIRHSTTQVIVADPQEIRLTAWSDLALCGGTGTNPANDVPTRAFSAIG